MNLVFMGLAPYWAMLYSIAPAPLDGNYSLAGMRGVKNSSMELARTLALADDCWCRGSNLISM